MNRPGLSRATMSTVNRSAATTTVSPPRRFILLPEVVADAGIDGPRVRRYRLTSVGLGAGRRRAGLSGVVSAEAGMPRVLGPMDRMT